MSKPKTDIVKNIFNELGEQPAQKRTKDITMNETTSDADIFPPDSAKPELRVVTGPSGSNRRNDRGGSEVEAICADAVEVGRSEGRAAARVSVRDALHPRIPVGWLWRPGGGKSTKRMVEAVAMVSGRALLGVKPVKRLKVWYWNGEDPQTETDRRFAAICNITELSGRRSRGGYSLTAGATSPSSWPNSPRRGPRLPPPSWKD